MTGALVNKWDSNTSAVSDVCFSPSGRHIISSSRDKSVAIFSNLTLKEVGRWVSARPMSFFIIENVPSLMCRYTAK